MDDLQAKVAANQESAPRISPAEHVRTLLKDQKYGTVSVMSSSGPTKGFPSGALMPYVVDEQGRIICCLSDMSAHKRDLQADGRATVVVAQAGFADMSQARCSVTGTFAPITVEKEVAAARETYLASHSEAFWIDFGDFSYLRMEDVVTANLVAGFGRAHKVSNKDFYAAAPDPVSRFSAPICVHMNSGHEDACVSMVQYCTGLDVDSVQLLGLDRLGLDAECKIGDASVSLRLAFPEPVDSRKAIKEQLMAMTNAAQSASDSG